MSARPTRFAALAAAFATAASIALPVATAAPAGAAARGGSLPPTALLGDGGTPVPLKNQAQIVVSDWGLRYQAGQQDSNLTITQDDDGRIRYVDTGTERWRELPDECKRVTVSRGISAVCSIPEKFQDDDTMFLEVWPRLGNDRVDGSTISSSFRLWVLADAGRDSVITGHGDDFVNGAQDADRVWGGSGDDWLRTGIGNDRVSGGAGDDKVVGADDNDQLYGNTGNDHVYGGSGTDTLWSNDGDDSVSGGSGRDTAYAKRSDRVIQCESVRLSG